ncbi:discoidin domain-containing protein [Paenibacillus sp. FSL R5-0887]|uniref:discoidin domain-containing protein n=1 Tax=unclassified Paenibacillus TaxID=185978 RepID=UPI0030F692A9
MKKKIYVPIIFSLLLLFSFVSITKANTTTVSSLIPVMTSNTSPSGVVSASSEWGIDHQAFNAFNNNNNDYGWASKEGVPYGWIAYEFESPQIVNSYSLTGRGKNENVAKESPKNWTFEGWDGENWVVLDTQNNITGWTTSADKVFAFNNEKEYKKYRLNISENNGYSYFVTIGEIKMNYTPAPEPTTTPTPEPTFTPVPTPSATPEVPTGNRAILTVTLTTGLEKEFDLPMSEVTTFLNWYDSASESARYGIDKHENNKGPFSKRTEYVVHDKILTFEVSEYTIE